MSLKLATKLAIIGIKTISDNEGVGAGVILLSLLCGVIGCITCLAISEVILVFIDIEHNTRSSHVLLKKFIRDRS